ncbi:MAG: restriction endonuclease subunit S [Bacteroidetes bacterium]|nr:restriction endonuclease subunit S [Bacteroidota bacterium]MBM3455022.1 hypothetical protein [Bacteroidota bacterium]
MSEWIEKYLIDFSILNYGDNLPTSELKSFGYPVFGANGYVGFSDRYNIEIKTVLISCRGENSGVINIVPEKTFVTNNSIPVKLKTDEIDVEFLYYLLQTISKSKIVSGSAQPQVTINDLKRVSLKFPSLKAQRKIAKILSTTDTVIEKTQASIAKYKAIKQGMLHDLFTRGIDIKTGKLRPKQENAPELYKESALGWIPKEWDEKIINQIAKVNGRVGWKGYTVSDLRENGPLALGAMHIDKDNKLDLTNSIHLSNEKYLESPEIMVFFGDILIVQRGTIGKIVIIDKEIGDATINPSMVLLNNITKCNTYIYYQLCSFIGQSQIENLTSQTGVPMISQEQIKNIKLAIPKEGMETEAIANRLKSIDNIIANEKSFLLKQQQIKSGLMSDLLSGKKLVTVKEELETQTN